MPCSRKTIMALESNFKVLQNSIRITEKVYYSTFVLCYDLFAPVRVCEPIE
jgi:hypothetical protein